MRVSVSILSALAIALPAFAAPIADSPHVISNEVGLVTRDLATSYVFRITSETPDQSVLLRAPPFSTRSNAEKAAVKLSKRALEARASSQPAVRLFTTRRSRHHSAALTLTFALITTYFVVLHIPKLQQLGVPKLLQRLRTPPLVHRQDPRRRRANRRRQPARQDRQTQRQNRHRAERHAIRDDGRSVRWMEGALGQRSARGA